MNLLHIRIETNANKDILINGKQIESGRYYEINFLAVVNLVKLREYFENRVI